MPRKKVEAEEVFVPKSQQEQESPVTEEVEVEVKKPEKKAAKKEPKVAPKEEKIMSFNNVYQKLCYVRNSVHKPAKSNYNSKNNFYFFDTNDIRDSVQGYCDKVNVIITSSVTPVADGSGVCATSRFIDCDSGESISFSAVANFGKRMGFSEADDVLAATEFAIRISLANMFAFNIFKKTVFSDDWEKAGECLCPECSNSSVGLSDEELNEMLSAIPAPTEEDAPAEVIGENLMNAATEIPEEKKEKEPEYTPKPKPEKTDAKADNPKAEDKAEDKSAEKPQTEPTKGRRVVRRTAK